jgi:hypothetical protein
METTTSSNGDMTSIAPVTGESDLPFINSFYFFSYHFFHVLVSLLNFVYLPCTQ